VYYELWPGSKITCNSQCPLCKLPAFSAPDNRVDAILVICPACGKFRYSAECSHLLERLPHEREINIYKISHAMRIAAERASGKSNGSLFPIHTSSDFELILNRSESSVREKLELLQMYLGRLSKFPGESTNFDSGNDYTIIGASNYEEANFYLKSLHDQGFLSELEPYIGGQVTQFTVSSSGWLELDRISRSNSDSGIAFIAMWFDESRQPFDQAITEAIMESGYKPLRIDRTEHLNRIDDEIIMRIRQSKFLIADLSGQRNGVYFEAGFMMGLGRPVIWLCEKSELQKVHFDTRQYNTIDYVGTQDLRERLRARIGANIGQGPFSRPTDAP
jgi:hypothetical protein